MNAPKIQTAIPLRRYRLGAYTAVVLGEIESSDGIEYRYILALVREGEARPRVYVTAEKNPRARAQEGSHRMRVIMETLEEDRGSSDRWGDPDVFAAEGLSLVAGMLGLAEQAQRLM